MKVKVTAQELLNKGVWQNYCDAHGINEWAINEGLMDSEEEVTLSEQEAKKYGFIK